MKIPHRVSYLIHKEEILDLLAKGYSFRYIHAKLVQESKMTTCYHNFLRLHKKDLALQELIKKGNRTLLQGKLASSAENYNKENALSPKIESDNKFVVGALPTKKIF